MSTLQEARLVGEPDRERRDWPPELLDAYRTQRLGLVRIAYLITGDRQVGEEIVHDAFLATLAAWDRVRDAAPYLRVTVVNRGRTWLKRQKTEQRHSSAALRTATYSASTPDELWDVLGRLKPRQRAALVLRFYEDLPDNAIAELLGCRVATVRTTIHRALAALRKEIER